MVEALLLQSCRAQRPLHLYDRTPPVRPVISICASLSPVLSLSLASVFRSLNLNTGILNRTCVFNAVVLFYLFVSVYIYIHAYLFLYYIIYIYMYIYTHVYTVAAI